jgi:hypothetical protein
MLRDTELIKVTNINGSTTGYTIPELNVRKVFVKGETKNISVKELRALRYVPGGEYVLRNYLFVNNTELLEEFGITPEPEYSWTEDDVKDLLLNGSLERFQDCLDFAPKGIIVQLKDLAVSLEINDMSKRDAIFKATKFNVSNAIAFNRMSNDDSSDTPVAPKTGRRVKITD